jgi:NAD(P)-dependent dehydrogenase (short-subunit alcohol dehydrogenase family)
MKTRTRVLLATLAGIGSVVATKAALRRQRRISFHDKVVLVTGGSRGLGLLLAQELAGEGARVAVCARDENELAKAKTLIEAQDQQLHTFVCDLSQRSQIQQLIRDIGEQLGPIDVLINNAGVLQAGPMETMTVEDYDWTMAVNFWAPLYTTLEVLPSMRQHGAGRIVNISSIGGKTNSPHLLPYCASKHALTGLSQGMRIELAQHNIFVTTICPNLMQVGSMYRSLMKGQHRKEFAIAQILSANPLFSTSPRRATRWIIEACRTGEPVVVPSWRGSLLVLLFNLFPNLSQELLGLVERFMPTPDGPESIGTAGKPGMESTSPWAPSLLTVPNELNARKLNELDENLAQAILSRAPAGSSHSHN